MSTGLPLFDQAQGPAATRAEAAARIGPFAHDQRGAVLAFVRAQGRRGATDQQIHETLEICADSCRARRVELVQAGELVDSGQRRSTRSGRAAIVWTTPDQARTSERPATVDGPPIPPAARTSAPAAEGPAVDQPTSPSASEAEPGAIDASAGEHCPKCGGRRFVDVRIHGGESVRRDCRRCGAFIRFIVWRGAPVTPQRPGGVMARRAADATHPAAGRSILAK